MGERPCGVGVTAGMAHETRHTVPGHLPRAIVALARNLCSLCVCVSVCVYVRACMHVCVCVCV